MTRQDRFSRRFKQRLGIAWLCAFALGCSQESLEITVERGAVLSGLTEEQESSCGETDSPPLLELVPVGFQEGSVTVAVLNYRDVGATIGIEWRISSEKNDLHGQSELGVVPADDVSVFVLSLADLGADLSAHHAPGEFVAMPCFMKEGRCFSTQGVTTVYFLAPPSGAISVQATTPPLYISEEGERLARLLV